MKKIILFISALALLTFSSCDLDYYPGGAIEQQQAFQTVKDALSLRNQIYPSLRATFNGANYYATDIQADLVNATFDYGNVNGVLYSWDLNSNDYTVSDMWSQPYGRLANINNYLDNVGNITPKDEAETKQLALYTAEVHLARAILYRALVLRYAKDYEPASAGTDLGVPLVLTYDITAKPARSSVEAVYGKILEDIAAAKTGLTTAGAPNSRYLTVDCITALEAQVYLEMHNYGAAVTAADALITGDKYPLITTAAGLTTMWTNDNGSEIIFQPVFYDIAEAGANTGIAMTEYIGQVAVDEPYSPRYVPQQWVVNLFDPAKDIRSGVFLKQYNITISGEEYAGIWLVNKYPGNPALRNTGAVSNYMHQPKIFRIGEMHLIKAEALAWQGQDGPALTALNVLRAGRGLDALIGLTGQALKDEILNERTREMLCEGTRLYDLKRFKKPVERKAPQDISFVISIPDNTTIGLRKEAGDDLFVWGIPQNDRQTNPNLEQNPGW